ncbi:MAG: DUF1015 domain-containing protein [Treponema sp.]|jgi:hypothetical protein|nr:DUF1015 domain-containing protein [Treponema sp.]
MEDTYQKLAGIGLQIPEILIPGPGTDMEKWAVIACDQFTQDRAYWEKAAKTAGPAPSTLNLIFPEIYLQDEGRAARIRAIHQTMAAYLREGVFAPPRRGCVYLERNTPRHPGRRGLVIALDLEQYNWAPASRPLIRTTEGTVPERLPPRMEIRRGAALESPHILILIDDETDEILPGLGERAKAAAPAYQSPLMLGGGDISGWFLEDEADWAFLARGLESLAQRAQTRYGAGGAGEAPFLFAVGDGNHSLATAKEIWEEYKKTHAGEPDLPNHPCRYALAEIENLYDPAIRFEPIHRVLFHISLDELIGRLSVLPGFSSRPVGTGTPGGNRAALSRLAGDSGAAKTRLGLVSGNRCTLVEFDTPGLATVSLQPLLDELVQTPGKDTPAIDYIHGEDEIFRLAADPAARAVGILLPPVKKSGLFETVARSGPLPRKSFSMGEAVEKRYYLECRRLFGV